jgi:hypothetical protein
MSTTKSKSAAKSREKPPVFDRDKAIARLIRWHGATSATLEQVRKSTESLNIEIGRNPQLRELVNAAGASNLYFALEQLTCDVANDCTPRLVDMPMTFEV